MDVCHDWALRSWILGWGPFARVVSPATLANEIHADLEAAAYADTSDEISSSVCVSSGARCSSWFFAGPPLLASTPTGCGSARWATSQVFTTIDPERRGCSSAVAFVATVVWLSLNLHVAVSAIGDRRPIFVTREGIRGHAAGPAQLRTLARGVTMLVRLLIGLFAAGQWETWLTWRFGSPSARPIRSWATMSPSTSSRCPSCDSFVGMAQALVVLAALACGRVYLVSGSLTSGFPARLSMRAVARRHLAVLVAVFFLLLAWGAWLRVPSIWSSRPR